MKKNNRGFTLIELLAAIVILGILSVFALPVITNTLNDSRNKMYVSDAKRLISQAEYELKSNSSQIEKPKVGDCIVMSLSYLNATSIKTGPNGGTYDPDRSYVLVKGVENATTHFIEYQYSVALIEHSKKGGYIGISLTRSNQLKVSSVKSYKVADLVAADSVTDTYVKQRLGDSYLTGTVSEIYHYREIKDSSVSRTKSSPIIRFIEVYSNESNNVGSLNATLSLNATDADSEKSELKVFVSLSGFDGADRETYSYGENNSFTKVINFSNYLGHHYGYQDGANIILYVTVEDPDGNAATQSLSYVIHRNEAPIINDVSITGDTGVNFHKIVGTISVYDDISDVNSLKICFTEDKNATTCSNYRNYVDIVSNNNFYYTFKCASSDGKCHRDGSTNYLQVFLQDQYGAETHLNEAIAYTFPTNVAPTISNVTVTSKTDAFPTTGNKNFIVRLTATDDIPVENLKVHVLVDGGNGKTYSYVNGGSYEYSLNSSLPYDGSTKTVRVYVTDEENATSNISDVSYTMYQNQAPTISEFELVSREIDCIYDNGCTGSLTADIALSVSDDLDLTNQLQVCFSETSGSCTNFESYSNIHTEYIASNRYDGSEKHLYVTVKDPYGAVSQQETVYQVYQDAVPISTGMPKVDAVPNSYQIPLLDIYYYANMIDDLDEVLDYKVCYQLDGGDVTCGAVKSSSTGILHLDSDYFQVSPIQYAGQTVTLYALVKDSYHSWDDAVQTRSVDYVLFSNQPPEILSFDVLYDTSTSANIYFSVKDYTDEYQIGISESDTCADVTYLTPFYDGSDSVTHFIHYDYVDTMGDIMLCVKDKDGNIQSKIATPIDQNQYQQCSMLDYTTVKYQYTVASGKEGITRSRCNSKCYAYNPFSEDTNPVEGFYKRTLTYLDKFNSSISCPQEAENYTANCSFKDCFVEENQYLKAIGSVLYRADAEWTMQFGETVYSSIYYYKVYQSSYDEGDSAITLTEIEGERVHPALVFDNDFMADYVRIVDQYSE